jgi:hypothetical protein
MINQSTAVYRRFYRRPYWISRAFKWIALFILIATFIHLTSSIALNLWFILGFLSFIQLSEFGMVLVSEMLRSALVRESMRKFAGSKFSSWEEFGKWLHDTDPMEIERLCKEGKTADDFKEKPLPIKDER